MNTDLDRSSLLMSLQHTSIKLRCKNESSKATPSYQILLARLKMGRRRKRRRWWTWRGRGRPLAMHAFDHPKPSSQALQSFRVLSTSIVDVWPSRKRLWSTPCRPKGFVRGWIQTVGFHFHLLSEKFQWFGWSKRSWMWCSRACKDS